MSFRKFLQPAAHKERLPVSQADATYKKRWLQVFIGIFIVYAGYYLVRRNFSLIMPDLIVAGYTKADLGVAPLAHIFYW
jgi:OPA family glycerol-3-phosphate transporter-like MFS transporter